MLTLERIVGHEAGPRLLIIGGVHGDEFEPMAAIRRLIVRLRGPSPTLSEGELIGSTETSLLHVDGRPRCASGSERPTQLMRGTLTLIPVVNEPAFRLGKRTAEDGLDLARTCPGNPDGSITEQIAAELSALIRDSDYLIDLHTGGTRLRILPLVGYMLHDDWDVLVAQRRMAFAFDLPLTWGTHAALEGRTLSIVRDAKVPAIYAEYHGGGGCDPDGIAAYEQGCLNVMSDLRMIDDSPIKTGNTPFMSEDNRPGAGHLQINHPSPLEGFFEPLVELGQRVQAGQALGTVSNLLGQRVETIPADHQGIVIVLHTFSRVDQGECLAVVLETTL